MSFDLFSHADLRERQACGSCMELDPKRLDSGVRYCWRMLGWRRADDPACDRPVPTGPSWRPAFARAVPNQPGVAA